MPSPNEFSRTFPMCILRMISDKRRAAFRCCVQDLRWSLAESATPSVAAIGRHTEVDGVTLQRRCLCAFYSGRSGEPSEGAMKTAENSSKVRGIRAADTHV
jgi:hypothetical protein